MLLPAVFWDGQSKQSSFSEAVVLELVINAVTIFAAMNFVDVW